MKRPLPASPGAAMVNGAAFFLVIEDAVTVNDLHLDDIARYPPVFIADTVPVYAQFLNHSTLVILVQRNSGLTLAAVPAPGTDKYILERILPFIVCSFHHNAKKIKKTYMAE